MLPDAANLISWVAPAGTMAAELEDSGQPLPLHPEEVGYVEHAAEKRRRDFAAGRCCARAALAQLGLDTTAIARRADGMPVWPAGIAGSITHTKGYAAALVAPKDRFRGVGVDAERIGGVTDKLIPTLFGPAEQAWLETLGKAERRVAATILFSAKEAYYKVWSPLTQKPLSFKALHIALAEDGFVATQPDAAPNEALGDWRLPLSGRFAVRDDLVVTLLCLPKMSLPGGGAP